MNSRLYEFRRVYSNSQPLPGPHSVANNAMASEMSTYHVSLQARR